jgi:UrcA family protein
MPALLKALSPILLAASLPISAYAGLPTASVKDGRPTAIVRTMDLPLLTRRGRRLFKVRVAGAVEAVCGSYEGATPEELDRIQACRKNTIADISPQVSKFIGRFGPQSAARNIVKL